MVRARARARARVRVRVEGRGSVRGGVRVRAPQATHLARLCVRLRCLDARLGLGRARGVGRCGGVGGGDAASWSRPLAEAPAGLATG